MVNGDASTNQLYKTDVTISSCNDYYIYARPSTTSAYKGDSGGPLTISTNEGTQLIGIVEGGDENNPSLDEVSYVNIGVNRDWIARYASFYSISGSENVICNGSTATYSISAPGATIEVSPNLTIVSQTSSSVTVRGNVQGRGYVNIKAGNTTMAQKAVWVGAPIISGVTYNSGYLRVETLGGDAGITYTEWTIGSNLFTAYSSSIACPYSSGTFNVSVKARNSCGTSAAFNTQITIPSYYSYAATVDSEARSVTVAIEREADGASPMSAPASGTLRYALASLTTGQLAATGTLPAAGGTIDCANLPNGLYALKLFTPDGTEQAFKITLR